MSLLLFYIVRNLFHTIGDLAYQSPLVLLPKGSETILRIVKQFLSI
jgi:hypothetical protein